MTFSAPTGWAPPEGVREMLPISDGAWVPHYTGMVGRFARDTVFARHRVSLIPNGAWQSLAKLQAQVDRGLASPTDRPGAWWTVLTVRIRPEQSKGLG